MALFGSAFALAGAVFAATNEPAAAGPGSPVLAKVTAPRVHESFRNDTSPPLWLIAPKAYPPRGVDMHEPFPLPGRPTSGDGPFPVSLEKDETKAAASFLASLASPLLTFEGTSNVDGRVPPDTTGDVGPNHVVEWVNLSFAIFDRAGNTLYGPVPGNTLWAGLYGRCETSNGGDPLVLYDALADRWVISQLAFDWPHDFHQCVAVSQTPDPTGPWHRYDFLFDPDKLNDYPKLAVWPDAYYIAINQFDGPTRSWRGQGALAYDRAAMLIGRKARQIYFDLYSVNPNFGGALPSDLDGPIPPPPGSPNYFVAVDDDAWGWGIDRLSLWEFHVDWTTPAASTFGIAGQPNAVINLSAQGLAFDSSLCAGGACIPQPGGTLLDPLSDRLMYRLAYRNFGTHESLVVNHTVDENGANHAGVRWYEIRDPGGAPTIHQGGTFAPDADHRWMASAAMNGAEGIAIGYSVSSTTTFPSIRYAGRRAPDPLGTMALGEASLVEGGGYQTGASRWGDYSTLTVDPTDDCTFWYLGEYYGVTGPVPWRTRVGAFKLDGCGQCPLVGASSLTVAREGLSERLTWTAATNAAVYDVVEGSLGVLHATGGDFALATTGCGVDDLAATTALLTEADPAPGDGRWYLVRGVLNGCRGTLGEPSGSAARDTAIQSAAASCP
jgi:hypothetical protein